MDANPYLNRMKNAQKLILEFIETDERPEKDFQISSFDYLKDLVNEQKKQELKEILYLLVQITNNHSRNPTFYSKIYQIISQFQSQIVGNFSNEEIFQIFVNCNFILSFLLKENIIKIDKNIIKFMSRSKQQFKFFIKELQLGSQGKSIENNPNIKNENDDPICIIIRNDSVDEFISYTKQNNISLDQKIEPYSHETNQFLISKSCSLIEYAMFFGSTQIVQYLSKNGIELSSTLWMYAIHSNKENLIHFLEEKHVELDEKLLRECLIESIKCHHNKIANYIQNNLMKEKVDVFPDIIQSCNYSFFPDNLVNYFAFLVKINNFSLVKFILDKYDIDINSGISVKEGNMNIEKTPLHIAIENENVAIIQLLLENPKIDVNKIEKNEVFEEEKEKCKNINNEEHTILEEKTALILAIEKENIEIIQLLLRNANIDINKKNSFIEMSKHSHRHTEKTALHFCVERKKLEIIKLLVSNPKIDINSQLITLRNKDIKEIKNDEEGNIIEFKKTVLHIAVENENKEIIQILLTNSKIDINIKSLTNSFDQKTEYIDLRKSYNEKTALHIAVEKENIEIVRMLLSNPNIDTNIISIDSREFNMMVSYSDKYEETPLHVAVKKKNVEIAKLLLANQKTDVNAISHFTHTVYRTDTQTLNADLSNSTIKIEEKTSLIYTMYNDDMEMMKLLLSSPKINPNVKYHYVGPDGSQTSFALEHAIEFEQYDMIQLLLQHGSEID